MVLDINLGRTNMQKKIFLYYLVLIGVLVCLVGFYSVKISHSYFVEEYKRDILKEGNLIFEILKNMDSMEDSEKFIKETADNLGLHISMIDQEGNLIIDSKGYHQNQKNMSEVQKAFSGQKAIITRKNEVYGEDYIYIAIPITFHSEEMVLRFSILFSELDGPKTDMIINIIISSVIVLLLGYYLSKKVAEPLDTLTNAVAEVSQGKYNKKIPVATNDQIGYLAGAFNRMCVKLNTTINALETENKRMEAIVNSMINGVVAIDKKNKILMINSQCYDLFHIKNKYCKGLNFYDIFKNEDIQTLLEISISEKRSIVDIVILKSKFNGDKILRVYINPIFSTRSSEDSLGTLLVFQDVTQIKKLEKMRSDFVSNVTHELKTPLTSIMGFTDTLRSGGIYDKEMEKHFLEIIDIETHRLYRLIQDILSLSEIETRKKDTNMQQESIEEILIYVEGLLRPQAEEKGLQLLIEYEAIPPYFCNKDRISQMFINLIENAIKYTEKGKIIVRCKYQGESFLLQVIDTGIGIPEESIDRIFERFYRVDKGRSRKAGGTGLGLSIVKHIMMLYNGKVKVESTEGKGTIFTITMPYKM